MVGRSAAAALPMVLIAQAPGVKVSSSIAISPRQPTTVASISI